MGDFGIQSKWFPAFEETIPDQTGKIVVITGTTTGTGNVAAKTSLKKGATVAMLNRNEQKARDSMEGFFNEHEDTRDRAHFIECDLQNFKSVEHAANELKENFKDGIDVLCNNAGVMALADQATVDGYDVQMQTNHLSHFLLTKLLLPSIEKKSGRIVNHSSGARFGYPGFLQAKYFGKNGGNLGGDGANMLFGARWQRYQQTKLANSVFTCELQKRLDAAKSSVTVYCAHPGLAATELQKTTKKDGGFDNDGLMKRAQTPEDGSMGILKCMFLPNLVKGGMYGPLFATGPADHRFHGPFATNAGGKLLWTESEKACGTFDVTALVESKL